MTQTDPHDVPQLPASAMWDLLMYGKTTHEFPDGSTITVDYTTPKGEDDS